jgi:hypothetical protein
MQCDDDVNSGGDQDDDCIIFMNMQFMYNRRPFFTEERESTFLMQMAVRS